MKVEIEIQDQDIIDVMVTALEGGSNYWYYLPDLSMVREHFPKGEKPSINQLAMSEKITKAVLEHGAVVPVYDVEDDDNHLGDISQENIKRGLQLFMDDKRAWDPGMDAGEADVFFQYVVMSEIVYG